MKITIELKQLVTNIEWAYAEPNYLTSLILWISLLYFMKSCEAAKEWAEGRGKKILQRACFWGELSTKETCGLFSVYRSEVFGVFKGTLIPAEAMLRWK